MLYVQVCVNYSCVVSDVSQMAHRQDIILQKQPLRRMLTVGWSCMKAAIGAIAKPVVLLVANLALHRCARKQSPNCFVYVFDFAVSYDDNSS